MIQAILTTKGEIEKLDRLKGLPVPVLRGEIYLARLIIRSEVYLLSEKFVSERELSPLKRRKLGH